MKNKEKNNDNINVYADLMLNQIISCVKNMMQDVPKIKSAIVDSINDDNTVNIRLPGNDKVYTKIQNQSVFQDLVPGDLVKLLLEDGSFSNCWIIARYPRQAMNYLMLRKFEKLNFLFIKYIKTNKKRKNFKTS